MNNVRRKILWLVSWYPNKLAPFDGDFIQRHARAVALLHDVEVIFIKKDDKGVITNNTVEEIIDNWPGLTERIIYYNPSSTKIGVLNKILSDTAYQYFFKLAVLRYLKLNGKPDVVHVHIAMKAGLLALWLKKKKKINYILSEQWTGYLQNASPNLDDSPPVYRRRTKEVVTGASVITTVSNVLGEAMQSRFKIPDFFVVPNVVDTNIFFPIEKTASVKPTFIHVSLLVDQKDPVNMINGFRILKERGFDFSLIIYGPVNNEVRDLVHNAGLDAPVIFKDEVPQSQLSKEVQQADAMVLFSKYETFGCVVIEANACGIPVILSDLEVFREYSIEGKTCVFAQSGNAEALANALEKFIKNRKQFNKQEIANYTTEKFRFLKVAEMFDKVYTAFLSNQLSNSPEA